MSTEHLEFLRVFNYENKIQVGIENVGDYIIAEIGDYDHYLSCGVGNDESFSNEFLQIFPGTKEASSFDHTIKNLPDNYPRQMRFYNKKVSNVRDANSVNLEYFINNYKNLFLKMNIDGGEYAWLSSLNKDKLNKFKQLVIVFYDAHGSVGAPFELKKQYFKNLAETHYLVNVTEAKGNNTYSIIDNKKISNNIELTYVRKDVVSIEDNDFINFTDLFYIPKEVLMKEEEENIKLRVEEDKKWIMVDGKWVKNENYVENPGDENEEPPVSQEEVAVVQEVAAEEPVQEVVAEEPVQEVAQEVVTDEPVQEVIADEPVQEAVTEKPVHEVVAEEPVQEAVAEEPVQEVVAEEPVQEVVAEEPVQEVVAEEPVQEVVADEPVQEVVAEEPVQEEVSVDVSEEGEDVVEEAETAETEENENDVEAEHVDVDPSVCEEVVEDN
jgi:hypothetical protein